jgi:hypothetical protein
MSDNAVQISFDKCVAEHIAADRLYYQSTTFANVDKVVSAALVLAGCLLVYAFGVTWWTLAPFLLAVLEWFNLLSPRPLVRRYWFKQNPKFLETYHLTLHDAGIHFLTDSIDAQIKWDHYSNVIENDRMYLLIYGKGMYTIIPKRAFANVDDVTRFHALIDEHIIKPAQSTTT